VFAGMLWRMARMRLLLAGSYSNMTAQRAMAWMRAAAAPGPRCAIPASTMPLMENSNGLLTNGDLAHRMPSWSRLREGERWQIVRYLHTLPVASCCPTPERLHG
jgi:hypothetical protein